MNYSVKQHKFGRQYKGFHFFVLCKGLNSGKPFEKELQNCFVVQAADEETAFYLLQLCDGLFKAGAFKQSLIGSAIPFIRIGEFKAILAKHLPQVATPEVQKALKTMGKLEQHEKVLREQLKLIPQLKKALFYEAYSQTQN